MCRLFAGRGAPPLAGFGYSIQLATRHSGFLANGYRMNGIGKGKALSSHQFFVGQRLADYALENGGHLLGGIHFPDIVAAGEFNHITIQMLRAHAVECSMKPFFEQGPEIFQSVCMRLSTMAFSITASRNNIYISNKSPTAWRWR